MVSHGLVRFFPSLVFPSFFRLVLIFFSFYFFFSFIFTVHWLLYCVSPLIPCNYETTRVFYTLFVDFLACYDSHHLLAFLYISAPFYCFNCVSCHFYSVILFLFNFYRSSCVLCLVHAFFYMFLQSSTVYNHFLQLLEWNCAKLHSKTQWSFMLCVWLFESAFLIVLMPFHRLVCALECPKMFIFIYAWF